MSWSTSELRLRLAPLNRFKPSSKIFYWPFQGGTSFVDLLCFCSVLCLLCLCAGLFICALWSPAGKGLTSWLSFVVSTVSLSLSHWYPGSGVVLYCIDSWSLHPYLLKTRFTAPTSYPGIKFRLPCTPRTIFHGCQIVYWEPLNAKRMCPQKILVGAMWKCIVSMATHSRFKKGGYANKSTHISAVTYPRLLNLIPIKT